VNRLPSDLTVLAVERHRGACTVARRLFLLLQHSLVGFAVAAIFLGGDERGGYLTIVSIGVARRSTLSQHQSDLPLELSIRQIAVIGMERAAAPKLALSAINARRLGAARQQSAGRTR
jgi:hypothetical protein